jgi:hypothetical protein
VKSSGAVRDKGESYGRKRKTKTKHTRPSSS